MCVCVSVCGSRGGGEGVGGVVARGEKMVYPSAVGVKVGIFDIHP